VQLSTGEALPVESSRWGAERLDRRFSRRSQQFGQYWCVV